MLAHSIDSLNRRAGYVAFAKLSCSFLQSGGGRVACAADFLEHFFSAKSAVRSLARAFPALSGQTKSDRTSVESNSEILPEQAGPKRQEIR
jgi:hypothetical protein